MEATGSNRRTLLLAFISPSPPPGDGRGDTIPSGSGATLNRKQNRPDSPPTCDFGANRAGTTHGPGAERPTASVPIRSAA